ncbi:hypothetical protein B9Z55_019799 [Caenorhabditis nigoni]|uniref:Uncharacterized protein n=1 Tax=Caenorhabditis nigoni TaxID=1611254 RepID=A0A2G5TJY1_9PELO|nr:hypothetical protein B9Z55_019799 [Caenorhabditis nigoni]
MVSEVNTGQKEEEERKMNEATAPPVIVINSSGDEQKKEKKGENEGENKEGTMGSIDSEPGIRDVEKVEKLEKPTDQDSGKCEISGSVSSSSFEEINAEAEVVLVEEIVDEPTLKPVDSEEKESEKIFKSEEPIEKTEEIEIKSVEIVEKIPEDQETTPAAEDNPEKEEIVETTEENPVVKMREIPPVDPVAAPRPIRRLSVARASMMAPKPSPRFAKYMEPVRGRFLEFCSFARWKILCIFHHFFLSASSFLNLSVSAMQTISHTV